MSDNIRPSSAPIDRSSEIDAAWCRTRVRVCPPPNFGSQGNGKPPEYSPDARPWSANPASDFEAVGNQLSQGRAVKVRPDGSLTMDPNAEGLVIKPQRVYARRMKAMLRPRPEVRIHLPPDVEAVIRHVAASAPKRDGRTLEVGGVLLGARHGNDIFVSRATGPGPGAEHQEFSFQADAGHAQVVLLEEALKGPAKWVGGYHLHPEGVHNARHPSAGDEAGFRDLLAEAPEDAFHCHVILTPEGRGFRMDGYVMGSDKALAKADVVTYAGDPFARVREVLDVADLAGKTVSVLGVGAGGSTVAIELAKAGVGRMILVDPDVLEVANVSRHAAGLEQVGRPKVDAVAELILRRNPDARVAAVKTTIDGPSDELRSWLSASDVVAVCLDDERAKHTINRLAIELGVTAIYGGVYPGATGGDVLIVAPQARRCCYECFARYNQSLARPTPTGKVDYLGEGPIKASPGTSVDSAVVALLHAKAILRTLQPVASEPHWQKSVVQWTNVVEPGTFPEPCKAKFLNLQPHPQCGACQKSQKARVKVHINADGTLAESPSGAS